MTPSKADGDQGRSNIRLPVWDQCQHVDRVDYRSLNGGNVASQPEGSGFHYLHEFARCPCLYAVLSGFLPQTKDIYLGRVICYSKFHSRCEKEGVQLLVKLPTSQGHQPLMPPVTWNGLKIFLFLTKICVLTLDANDTCISNLEISKYDHLLKK